MRIEHIALYVNDLEAARSFFMKYLGAKPDKGYHNPKPASARAFSRSGTARGLS